MNDSFNQDMDAGVAAASENKLEGFAPLLIKQCLDSPEGHFQLFGTSFGMVVCTAIVRAIDTSSTKITYLLEDHTGRIEAHFWLEEDDSMKTPDVMLNNYAKACGSLRSQGGKKNLMVFEMTPISNPNEINTHLLEVLFTRFKAEQMATKGIGNGNFAGSVKAATDASSSDRGLEGKQLAVFEAIRSHNSDKGMSRQELQRKFAHISSSELNTILEFMSSEGHIYSSIDTDHFLCTE